MRTECTCGEMAEMRAVCGPSWEPTIDSQLWRHDCAYVARRNALLASAEAEAATGEAVTSVHTAHDCAVARVAGTMVAQALAAWRERCQDKEPDENTMARIKAKAEEMAYTDKSVAGLRKTLSDTHDAVTLALFEQKCRAEGWLA